ncbi:unnamed protein product [Protopolystoma xenopodis]|uniref:Uncharacterized protein n=1 Tax=Protopolystoma xenopodis TaxID=117903 RepID=A0A448X8W4_9PLAT|nr:unnamed protein product [Protopolystoma xenopodis]
MAILYKSVPELRKLTRLLDKFERLFAILPQNLRHVMDQLLDFELIAENCTGRPSRGQPEAGRRSHSRQLLILRQNEEIVAHLLPRMHRHQLAAQELGHVLHRMEEKLQVYSKALYQLAAWHLLLEPAVTAGLSETSGRESLAEPMLRDHEADSAASKDAGSGKTA